MANGKQSAEPTRAQTLPFPPTIHPTHLRYWKIRGMWGTRGEDKTYPCLQKPHLLGSQAADWRSPGQGVRVTCTDKKNSGWGKWTPERLNQKVSPQEVKLGWGSGRKQSGRAATGEGKLRPH